MRGRPDRLAFSRCSTAKLLRIRRARATKGAEWSSRGVFRASKYCRQLVCWGRSGLGQAGPALLGPRGPPPSPIPHPTKQQGNCICEGQPGLESCP